VNTPLGRSDMAYVLKGFYNFTCTPPRSSANVMNHTCLCLLPEAGTHLPTPEGWTAELASNT